MTAPTATQRLTHAIGLLDGLPWTPWPLWRLRLRAIRAELTAALAEARSTERALDEIVRDAHEAAEAAERRAGPRNRRPDLQLVT